MSSLNTHQEDEPVDISSGSECSEEYIGDPEKRPVMRERECMGMGMGTGNIEVPPVSSTYKREDILTPILEERSRASTVLNQDSPENPPGNKNNNKNENNYEHPGAPTPERKCGLPHGDSPLSMQSSPELQGLVGMMGSPGYSSAPYTMSELPLYTKPQGGPLGTQQIYGDNGNGKKEGVNNLGGINTINTIKSTKSINTIKSKAEREEERRGIINRERERQRNRMIGGMGNKGPGNTHQSQSHKSQSQGQGGASDSWGLTPEKYNYSPITKYSSPRSASASFGGRVEDRLINQRNYLNVLALYIYIYI